jgi:predicted nucleotidyltransferase
MQLLTDCKGLTKQEKNLMRKCKKIIAGIDPSATLILYGSRARGDAEEESDYDLIILTDQEATLEREDEYRKQLFSLQIETGTVLTVLLVGRKEWDSPLSNAMPFFRNVKREGIYL